MTRPIPQELLADIVTDHFYKKCCLCPSNHVQLHHNLIFGGRQVNEKFCILPLCPSCHAIEKRKDIHDKLDRIMLNRATDKELIKYSKITNLIYRRDELNKSFTVQDEKEKIN